MGAGASTAFEPSKDDRLPEVVLQGMLLLILILESESGSLASDIDE